MTRLTVALDFGPGSRVLGQIDWDTRRRVAAFEWDQDFRRDPLPVSPIRVRQYDGLLFGDAAAFDGLPGLFGDSLPDGWGRLLVDREMTRRGRGLHRITPVDRLAIVGLHGMGALTYRPEEVGEDSEISLDWFARALAQIEGELPVADLARLRAGSGGSAGARPKFVAQLQPAEAVLRDHRAAADPDFVHVIVKYRSRGDSPTAAEEEEAYASMARAAGVEVPGTHLLRGSDASFFAAERFDRQGGSRLHMHTAAGLLGIDFRQPALDYDNLLRLTGAVTRDQRQVAQMYRRMVFNVLAHNRDDHAKNHAFVMDAAGVWRLSPAYDLSFSDGPGGEHHLAVHGNGRDPGKAELLALAPLAGLRPQAAAAVIDEVAAAVVDWPRHADSAGVPAARRAEISARVRGVAI